LEKDAMRAGRLTNAVVATLVVMLNATIVFADKTEAPDEIIIHSKIWPAKKNQDAKFTHKKHVVEYKIECTQCHHVYEDGKNIWKQGEKVQKCEECHTNAKTGKELSSATEEEKKLSLFKAIHDNCRGCHLKEKKGPTKCTECHKKKSGTSD
jgi:hypothetical protein